MVKQEIDAWRAFNLYRAKYPLSLLARALLTAGEHPAWFSASLPAVFVLVFVGTSFLPTDWLPGGWASWKDAEQLTYFSTLWSVQATLAALVYPIVIAFVAVFLQRRPASETFIHLYMLNSGALAAGLSSLILVVVMAVQYVLLPYTGASALLDFGALDSVWFAANAILTAHFLFRTVEFLRPEVQSNVVRRYVANVALPREIRRLYLFQVFAQVRAKGWIPAPDYLDDKAQDGPKVLLSRYGFGDGDAQGTLILDTPSRLVNVRLWPLWLVVMTWMNTARRWPRPAERPRHLHAAWPLLTVPMTPGTEYRDSVSLAQVEAGPGLSPWQRRVLRAAFVFRPINRERYDIRLKSIVEEFEVDARDAAAKADVGLFERSYNSLIELHEFLLGACLVENDDGSVGSWALMPDIQNFFEQAVHVGWNNAYRSIFAAAINAITNDTSPVRRLCYIAQHLSGEALQQSPVEIRERVLDLPTLLMYQLSGWWVQRTEEQGVKDHGPHQMVTANAPLQRLYEEILLAFVSGWENARTQIAEVPEASGEFDWESAPSIARLSVTHIQETARMLLAAVARGDVTAAEWFADILSKWWGNLLYENEPLSLLEKTAYLTTEDLKRDWSELARALGIVEQDIPRLTESTPILQRGVLLGAIRNFWADIRLLTLELLLSWASQDHAENLDQSLAMKVSADLLTGRQWRGGGTSSYPLSDMTATDYLESKVRQYAAGGNFRSGYVGILSRFVERIKDMQRPGMVGSRVYSLTGADDVESLQEQQLVLMAALSVANWTPSASLQRQVDVWMLRQYDSVEIIRNRVRAWLDRLSQPEDLPPKVLAALLERTGRTYDTTIARERLTHGLGALRDFVESRRGEILNAEPVDPERLTQLAKFASRTAFSPTSGTFPLQLFDKIEFVPDDLHDFTLTMQEVRKGELTRVEMDQRAANEEEFWAETMRNRVGVLVLSDVLRNCDTRDLVARDAEAYWSALKSECARITALGEQPVLLLENPTKPDWVWQWQHADFGLGDGRPEDLRVWRANGRGHGYVCNFNEIEVYSAPLPPGRSILLAREVFREVAFRKFDDERYVDATFTEREDSKQLVDVHLRLSRRVQLGGQDTVRLFYVAEAGRGD